MLLALLHLADSALPVGAAAHSFGIETMVEDGCLSPQTIEPFLRDYLAEAGVLDAAFVRRAWNGDDARALNDEFGARRLARESRDASLKMGRRFSRLVNSLLRMQAIPDDLAYPIAFGMAAARTEIPETEAVLGYLSQSIAGMVSACQRLMPMGQVEASCLIWNLRPFIQQTVEQVAALESEMATPEMREVTCFTPLLELGSARHGMLETRLFIS